MPSPTPLAGLLGKEASVSLGHCTLQELPGGVSQVRCEPQWWTTFLPYVVFAILSFLLAVTFLRQPDRTFPRPGDVARSLLAAIPGLALTYWAGLVIHAHSYAFDHARQTLTHESRVLGSLVRADTRPLAGVQCATPYWSGTKNRVGLWRVVLIGEGMGDPVIGRLGTEADAQALCRYLLAPASER